VCKILGIDYSPTVIAIHFSRAFSDLHICEPNNHSSAPCLRFNQLYTTILSIYSLLAKSWSSAATRSNIVILLTDFAIYLYRDVWPLATYSQTPKDVAEGWRLWVKIGVLGVTAVLLPLFSPRKYVPADPEVCINNLFRQLST